MGEATDKIRTPNWEEDQVTSTRHEDAYVASEVSDEYDPNAEQIRAEIEDTRAEMSQTINEIQERLSPENLMQQAKETVREATIGKAERVMNRVGETIADATEPAREVMGRAGTAIKETGVSVADGMWRNPIPVALIGLGLGMLMVRQFGRKGNGYDYQMPRTTPRPRQYVGTGASRYGSTQYGSTEGAANQVKETASDLVNRSTTALSDLGTKARDNATALSTRFGQVLRENPLAIGAVAVAAGTAVGLALPSTRFEHEYIGETSEMLVDKAQEVARGAIDKVQDAAQQMAPEQKPGM
jgi:ElaB/YqjD/DUF883 family membrane-anchored ribosome-binding protein